MQNINSIQCFPTEKKTSLCTLDEDWNASFAFKWLAMNCVKYKVWNEETNKCYCMLGNENLLFMNNSFSFSTIACVAVVLLIHVGIFSLSFCKISIECEGVKCEHYMRIRYF